MKTNNKEWGLYGTATTTDGQDPDALWKTCMEWLQTKYKMEAIDARNYLDSKCGRHLADALTHMTLDEIDTKWAKYMNHSVRDIQNSRDAFDA